ncbi:MAG: alpha/beta hydrolase [Campylobacterales bacterium]|nr:alpha/beta hydrolase [Campylobacterales bacterium]
MQQQNFLYHPTPKIKHHYDEFTLYDGNGSIEIIVANEGKKKALIYFGGNGESAALSVDDLAQHFSEFTIYVMNYRGFGGSTGVANEQILYSDALKLYDTIVAKYTEIIVMGRSLGSGISTYLAANREIGKLILITPFNSIVDVAQGKYPLYPMRLLLKETYDSVDRIHHIKAQTFILAAGEDKVVPMHYTQKLFDAFPKSQVSMMILENVGHTTISSHPRYFSLLLDFMIRQHQQRHIENQK